MGADRSIVGTLAHLELTYLMALLRSPDEERTIRHHVEVYLTVYR